MDLTLPDQFWNSPSFPVWLTLAAAAFFGLLVLITLLRAEKSVANGALTVITLLAVGIAVASTMRTMDTASPREAHEPQSAVMPAHATLPALACLDDLAGDLVLASCEKTLFGSADATAAAVSYAGAMISRLVAGGDVNAANKAITPDLLALRRAVEHDRYGLMAYVLLTRDRCTPADCYAFRSMTDHQQIASNMEGRAYEGLVTRYASQWNAPQAQSQAPPSQLPSGPFAGLAPSIPTGKPTNADFPSAASTPPVSIMVPEPTASTSRAVAPAASAPRTPSPAVAASHAQAPAKKPAPKPKPPAPAPQAAPEPAEPAANE